MLIQKQRFGSRLEYKLEIEGGLSDCYIPKLSLQPIVENAFVHGLEKKQGEWKLNIQVVRLDHEVTIRISDNGVGMDQERLAEMQSRLSKLSQQGDRVWSSSTSIGLVNAASRIVMHFGPAYGMNMESGEGQGTSVTVRIPCHTGGEIT